MTALALTLIIAAGPDPCAGVLDRTATCAAPDEVAATVTPDQAAGADPLGIAGMVAPEALPSKLALVAAALGMGGTAAIGASYAVTPPGETAEERQTRRVVRVGGMSAIALSGLVGGAAIALAVFDPSSGKARFQLIEENE
ncbi:MAG: hypothetical protein IT383_09825 [Deltaproteobacteria bacterium]|nr:hypothetical protein [Deltaproteobacteria bacterium]